jgi:hypothetical protein
MTFTPRDGCHAPELLNVMRNLIAAMLTLASGAVLAQETPPAPETTDATPSVDERMTETEGRVSSIEEQLIELKSSLSPLKKLKFSGYIQSRYQWEEAREDDTGGFSRFTVRRGRLKATYTGDIAQFVLQIDAVPTGVSLKDAEATLFLPGTQQHMSVTLGQMKYPFGYEVPQSSSEREFPERSRVVRAFLSGDRDRGVRYSGKLGVFRLNAGLFDGNGIDFPGSVGVDNDKEKDVIGRAGFDLKLISGGISGWYGHTLGKGVGEDFRHAHERSRLGVDLQVYLDVLPIGTTAIKGEYIRGRTYVSNGVENLDRVASGWYALLVQNIGLSDAVAIRYDYFDPANGVANAASAPGSDRPAGTNAVGTLGATALHNFSENMKLSVTYELPLTATVEGVKDPHDNLLTVQMQARF